MAQRKKDPHAGPGLSFPLDPEHIAAAWDEAGHAANPDEVKRKVINYARETGHLALLPDSAHAWIRAHGGDLVKKAKGGNQKQLLDYAYFNNQYGDIGKQALIQWAQSEGITDDLPDEAHGFMHANNMPHLHNEADHPFHAHAVHKAYNPEGIEILIRKSWVADDGNTYFEGWVSPGDSKDSQKDLAPPECFANSIKGYYQRGAPISSNHDMQRYPVGHGQRTALIRDGHIFQEEVHPVDPAPFEFLEEALASGDVQTGTYTRGALTESPAKDMVRKGNVRGLSWVGNVTKYEPLPGGGRKFIEVGTLWEQTVAAYPVHKDAAILIAKAYSGLEEEPNMDIEAMLQEMVNKKLAEIAGEPAPAKAPATPAAQPEVQAQKSFNAEEVAGIVAQALAAQQTKFDEQIETKVQKAILLTRGEPKESKQKTYEEQLNEDPIGVLVQKGQSAKSEDDFSLLEKHLIWSATETVIGAGLIGKED